MTNFKSFKYDNLERWCSYWRQIKEIFTLRPDTVLEVGIGNSTVKNYLKAAKINIVGLDIDHNLCPDFVGSVLNMPFDAHSFDLILCAEVLEHLPFNDFSKALNELKRVSKKYVILTLPHWGRHFAIELQLPFFKKLKFQHKLNLFPISHKSGGEHFWEIGKKNYPLGRIKNEIIKADFKIVNDYIVFESSYHHFFILESIP